MLWAQPHVILKKWFYSFYPPLSFCLSINNDYLPEPNRPSGRPSQKSCLGNCSQMTTGDRAWHVSLCFCTLEAQCYHFYAKTISGFPSCPLLVRRGNALSGLSVRLLWNSSYCSHSGCRRSVVTLPPDWSVWLTAFQLLFNLGFARKFKKFSASYVIRTITIKRRSFSMKRKDCFAAAFIFSTILFRHFLCFWCSMRNVADTWINSLSLIWQT